MKKIIITLFICLSVWSFATTNKDTKLKTQIAIAIDMEDYAKAIKIGEEFIMNTNDAPLNISISEVKHKNFIAYLKGKDRTEVEEKILSKLEDEYGLFILTESK